jgi:hypothetical protein
VLLLIGGMMEEFVSACAGMLRRRARHPRPASQPEPLQRVDP